MVEPSASGLAERMAGLSAGGVDEQQPGDGEEQHLSKNARKREEKRKKLEEERRLKEEEKKNKAATAAASGNPHKASAADDEDMDPTQYYENRLKTLDSLKTMGVNPYPHKFLANISIVDYIEKYKSLSDGKKLVDVTECLAGRVMNKRTSSSKLFFYDLYGGGVKVQVMADARTSELEESEFSRYHSSVKRGDIVGISGYPGKSNRGELSVFPRKFVVLSPCLHMMPRQVSHKCTHNFSYSYTCLALLFFLECNAGHPLILTPISHSCICVVLSMVRLVMAFINP
ncbi:hypothetical protein GUJ93_ZPchr0003g17051 [Zizania palustris]|uniref:lysine--tRNA ligase n=1 Tax=Zizania palustris TaxID=103762 RepID=A0A8J5SVH7_ZIZPA|nr:hypothetical protein GUJ93_ZPchr0003g17051 [Zizania palustris]